jgi:hypothetical protein
MKVSQLREHLKEIIQTGLLVFVEEINDINAKWKIAPEDHVPADGDMIMFVMAEAEKCRICGKDIFRKCNICGKDFCRSCAIGGNLPVIICDTCFKGIPEFITKDHDGLFALSGALSGKEAKKIISKLGMRAIVIGHAVSGEEEVYDFHASDALAELTEYVGRMILDRLAIDAIWIDGERYDYEPVIQVSLKKMEAVKA